MKKIFIPAILVLTACSNETFIHGSSTGTGDSGGGLGLLQQGKVQPELYDLHLVRYTLGVDFKEFNNRDEGIEFALNRLSKMPQFFLKTKTVKVALSEIGSGLEFTTEALPLLRDYSSLSTFEGPHTLTQVAVYDIERAKLFVNRDLWDLMDPLNQAALMIHEAIYKVLRDEQKIRKSDGIRTLVGYLFADRYVDQIGPFNYTNRDLNLRPPIGEFLPVPSMPAEFKICKAEIYDYESKSASRRTSFYLYFDPQNHTPLLNLQLLDGVPCYGDCVAKANADHPYLFEIENGANQYVRVHFSNDIHQTARSKASFAVGTFNPVVAGAGEHIVGPRAVGRLKIGEAEVRCD